MFGNLVTNRQLRQLIKANEIQIDPFVDESLKTTHYTLRPGRVLGRQADGSWKQVHNFKDDDHEYAIQENGYVVVEVREAVRIASEGIVGRFIPTSNLIEAGLDLVAGQIDNKYGLKGEGLRFGLKNLLPVRNVIGAEMRLAHVEFFDLRGITPDPVKLSDEERAIRLRRMIKAMDDGIDYEQKAP